MATSKWPQVQVKLLLVERWARDGLTEEQICKNLGVSRSIFNVYKNEHPDLLDALKKGREVAITEVENALFKRALGFNYEETKVSIRVVGGKEVKFTEKTTKYQAPDVAACSILLKNKDKERGWSDNPQKLELDKLMFEFHKKIEEAKVFGNENN
ncbi:MAG: transposase [Desulfosporosinus sp.]|nr:transposase [Desulfosporosinus sp.]